MQIGNQQASQINNIENLNGDFNISGNTFSMSIEIEKRKTEILEGLNNIEKELTKEGKNTNEIILVGNELKDSINANKSNIFDSYKKYAKLLKETTENTKDIGNTFQELLKIGGSIGSLITLLIK
ncbi:MAG: hypothetical protein PHR68_04050 [Candidatus Gracilibacteria bacterium]|nr:hypothetical protein [Candidatus Gracilibacteria bacterium]